MRDIKFRAFNNKTLEFEYFDLINKHCVITTLPIPSKGKWSVLEKFEQFTGLYDENGKEIYEGDILYDGVNEARYVVCFIKRRLDGNYILTSIYDYDYLNNERGHANFYGGVSHGEYVEVIGNIHENINFLEKE